MIRTLVMATTLFLASFATEARPANFDRTLCVTAVLDAGKVKKCVDEAVEMRNDKGEIYSAVVTCRMYAVPARALACAEYAVKHLDVNRSKISGTCTTNKPDWKFNCLLDNLMREDQENKGQDVPSGTKTQGQPARRGGTAR